jgi:hypothetical protein
MQQTARQPQIRAFNTRGTFPTGSAGARETRARRIRGYDDKGAVLFTIPASTCPRDSARTSLDHRAIRQRLEQLGARLVRCEIDALAGGHTDHLVRADGSIKAAYLVEGKLVSL